MCFIAVYLSYMLSIKIYCSVAIAKMYTTVCHRIDPTNILVPISNVTRYLLHVVIHIFNLLKPL